MQARWYQTEALQALWKFFTTAKGNPLIAMPTGTGKSLVLAEFIRGALIAYPTTRVVVLSHVKELLKQDSETLKRIWPNAPIGIYSAGLGKKKISQITFAGIASAAGNEVLFGKVDLIFIDEAHLVGDKESSMYLSYIAELKRINPALKVIGLTATPWRLGMGHLTNGGIFTDVAYDLCTVERFNRLVKEGFLAPLVPKKTEVSFDLGNVSTVAGEYNLNQLQDVMDTPDQNQAACREIVKLGGDRHHWMIFTTGIEHTLHVQQVLESMGIPAVSIHSKMTSEDRDKAITDFKRGKARAAVNQNILTTGFDFPELDLIAVLRPSKSSSLWVQMLGRGTRPADGKTDCLVLDFAGNTERLGPINDPVIPNPKGSGKGEGIAPVRLCDACGTYCHASLTVCPQCGAEFPRENKLMAQASTAPLIREKQDVPIIEEYPVAHVSYSRHTKAGANDMMLASYVCGIRVFKQWVCIEHEGFARRKAVDWWKERSTSQEPIPETTTEALARVRELRVPKSLKVWVNIKYPEILGATYE